LFNEIHSSFAFNYNFSQLKGSSDDGNATLKLQFRATLQSQELVEHVSLDRRRSMLCGNDGQGDQVDNLYSI
jgi:hypothetical protein